MKKVYLHAIRKMVSPQYKWAYYHPDKVKQMARKNSKSYQYEFLNKIDGIIKQIPEYKFYKRLERRDVFMKAFMNKVYKV